eukprot:g176.t1
MLDWVWESVLHHLYFLVLFVQRQCSNQSVPWKLNLEKECEFFQLIGGGDPMQCAEQSMTLFAGLWFNTSDPTEAELNWIGRLVMNYQHCEAIFHTGIIVTGLLYIVYFARNDRGKDGKAAAVPAWLRWAFFFFMFVETWLMCVPYLFLFDWAWKGFKYSPANPIVEKIKAIGNDEFRDGVYIGGMMMSFLLASVACIVLDGIALWKSWFHARNMDADIDIKTLYCFLAPAAAFYVFHQDFGEATGQRGERAERVVNGLHGLFQGQRIPWIRAMFVHYEL